MMSYLICVGLLESLFSFRYCFDIYGYWSVCLMSSLFCSTLLLSAPLGPTYVKSLRDLLL